MTDTTLHGRRRRATADCEPLFRAATKNLFRNNAFRITGLSVDASTREISRHLNKLKMMAELGESGTKRGGAYAVTPPPGLDEIREAAEVLKRPEERIVHEFFWFWPERFGSSSSDPAIQALNAGDGDTAIEIWSGLERDQPGSVVAIHNVALVWHLTALEWEAHVASATLDEERRSKIQGYWGNAFARWEDLVEDDRLWDTVRERIRQIDDPALPPSFARKLRKALPEAFDKINAEIALDYAERGLLDLARFHVEFMESTHQGLDNVERTSELVLAPARTRLKHHIQAAKHRAADNARDSAKAAHELLDQAGGIQVLFDLFFGEDHAIRTELFDEVARTALVMPIAYYQETQDDTTCLEILENALKFATSVELRQEIEEAVTSLTGNLSSKELVPLYEKLKELQQSLGTPSHKLSLFKANLRPELSYYADEVYTVLEEHQQFMDAVAIVLRGISIDAWNKYEDASTAVEGLNLAVLYANDSELLLRLKGDITQIHKLVGQKAGGLINDFYSQQDGERQRPPMLVRIEEPAATGKSGCLVMVAAVLVLIVVLSATAKGAPLQSLRHGTGEPLVCEQAGTEGLSSLEFKQD